MRCFDSTVYHCGRQQIYRHNNIHIYLGVSASVSTVVIPNSSETVVGGWVEWSVNKYLGVSAYHNHKDVLSRYDDTPSTGSGWRWLLLFKGEEIILYSSRTMRRRSFRIAVQNLRNTQHLRLKHLFTYAKYLMQSVLHFSFDVFFIRAPS